MVFLRGFQISDNKTKNMKVSLEKFMQGLERFVFEHIANNIQGEHAGRTQFAIGAAWEAKKDEICLGLKHPFLYDESTNTIDLDKIERVLTAGFKMSKNTFPIPLKFNFLGMEFDLKGIIHLKPEDWTVFKRFF